MKPWEQRREWILAYMADEQMGIDICNADFMWAYWKASDALGGQCFYGAPKVPAAARDLKRLYDEGAVSRTRVGLTGMGGMGFPRWVWSYTLTQHMRPVAELLKERLGL